MVKRFLGRIFWIVFVFIVIALSVAIPIVAASGYLR